MQTMLHILYFVLVNMAIVLLGFVFLKKRIVLAYWIMFAATILTVYLIFLHEQPILRMLAIVATTFSGMKVISVGAEYRNKKSKLPFKAWFVFATGWAGMRAQPFETIGAKALPDAWPMIRFGVSRIIAGLLLIALAHVIVYLHLSNQWEYPLVSGVLLIGLSLILHFGIISISAGMWRLNGVNTYYLFRRPAKALSLTEFWSKRWNIAFSEMTAIAIFRPLKNKLGSVPALMLAFIFSGFLHELALSVPVNKGYGLPTIYFVIQALVVLFEKLLNNYNIMFLQNKVLARIWLFLWLVLPLPLLFHAQFIKQIVWPLAGLVR